MTLDAADRVGLLGGMRLLRHVGACGVFVWATVASAATVQGVVFDDRNGNGVHDAGEPGLAQVEVSDGTTVVQTDAAGRYAFTARDGAFVFVVKPRDWSPPVDAQQLPQFFRRTGADGVADFPLMHRPEPDRFSVLLLTDPQPGSMKEVGYFERTLVSPLAANPSFAFSVTLGDVVNDHLELYPAMKAALARIGVPAYVVNGNHDLDIGVADDRGSVATFEQALGPTTYAFHYGRLLFIALNDIRPLGGPRYVGGLRDDQFAFIAALLKHAAPDEGVVVMMHIPWFFPSPVNAETFRPADRARLFALLESRAHVFMVSGHTHYQRHVFYGPADGWHGAQPLHEYNVAAACGSFWGGPPDETGIPVSTMADGTPHGYGVLRVDGTQVRTEYCAARHPADFQIGLHAPRAVKPRTGFLSYYANVFDGHEGWTVETRVDDRGWTPMRRVIDWDPTYAKAFLDQDDMEVPLATPRLPDPAVCYHLWRAYFPVDLSLGRHRVEVRATRPDGRVFTASTETKVVEPQN